MDPKRYTAIQGDGEVVRKGEYLTWKPPHAGGSLHYRYAIEHRRKDGGYDARITPTFAIVRGADLVPPATVRATRGARADARLSAEIGRASCRERVCPSGSLPGAAVPLKNKSKLTQEEGQT